MYEGNEYLINDLKCRIRELENKVEALRISRRVLMNLIDALEREKREEIQRLRTKNARLQKFNSRYAQGIINCNIKIAKLENEIRTIAKGSSDSVIS